MNKYREIWELTIRGNQEDPKQGNPIPYERTTQGSHWDPRKKRYAAWKRYVVGCWLEQFGDIPKFKNGSSYRLDVDCFFKNETHGDPENVRKGIQDSLFLNDKHVWGSVRYWHGPIPGVKIRVKEDKTAHQQDITMAEERHHRPQPPENSESGQ